MVGTTNICIVRARVVVPQGERGVHILDGYQSGICRGKDVVCVSRILCLFLGQCSLWQLVVEEVRARS